VIDVALQPFAEFAFMRRALVANAGAGAGLCALGCLLVLRRMSLVGDAMAHAVLPGAAAGFLLAGLSLPAMSLGGFVAALAVALAAGWVTRSTPQREDASFAAFYLIALALGVLLVSLRGSQVDLMRMLFGSVLAVDDAALLLMAGTSARPGGAGAGVAAAGGGELRPRLPAQRGRPGALHHQLLLVLLVANLVAGFQALGTLMAVGLLMLPAASARFWVAQRAGCRPSPAPSGHGLRLWRAAAVLPLRAAFGPGHRAGPARCTSSHSASARATACAPVSSPPTATEPHEPVPNRRQALIACALPTRSWPPSRQTANEPLQVVASFSLLADMVAQVGGDAVRCTRWSGADADAHAFDPGAGRCPAAGAGRPDRRQRPGLRGLDRPAGACIRHQARRWWWPARASACARASAR
jgi:zinc/manganese transport system permease protein